MQARHQLKGFLLRHDVRYKGKTSWCGAYYRWLGTLNFGAGAAQTAFTEYWQTVTAADDRVDRLTKALQASIAGWPVGLRPVRHGTSVRRVTPRTGRPRGARGSAR